MSEEDVRIVPRLAAYLAVQGHYIHLERKSPAVNGSEQPRQGSQSPPFRELPIIALGGPEGAGSLRFLKGAL